MSSSFKIPEPAVLDGALATEMERRGCDLDCKLWSAKVLKDKPELIYQVHRDYFEAGANFATTASYQASAQGLKDEGFTHDEAIALIRTSVQLALRAKADVLRNHPTRELYIAGSIGPYGAYLADGSEYTGNYHVPLEDMKAFHRPRMAALLQAGADLLAIETIPSYTETEALISLLDEFPAALAWFSFTLKDSAHISDGTPLSKVCELLIKSSQVVAVGVNCVPMQLVAPALSILSSVTKGSLPLLAYPNSGEEYDTVSETWKGPATKGPALAELAQQWRSNGAKLIGGCCRTSLDDIRTIKEALHTQTCQCQCPN
jgi:homocysteine S-methyltransferase